MSILVTGGAGFIGSNLVDFLVERGESVIVVDDLSTGKYENLSQSIAKITFINEKIETYDFSSCSQLTSIFHLAAQISVPRSIADFKVSSATNILGAINVIDHCSRAKIPLVYASSSAVYGALPFGNDESLLVDPLSPYAVDKHSMELYARIASSLHNISCIGLRFFNVYGPRQDPRNAYSGVISVFIDSLIRSRSITINGGYQTRDFVYVDDVVSALYESLKYASGRSTSDTINILTGTSTDIKSLANMIGDILETDVTASYQSLRRGDLEHSVGSTEKMVSVLGLSLKAMVPLPKGLRYTIESFRQNQ